MKIVSCEAITSKVYDAILSAAFQLPDAFIDVLKTAHAKENHPLSKHALSLIIKNNEIASTQNIPLCQDTGIVVCFVKIGSDVHIDGYLNDAINTAVKKAYLDGFLRASVVNAPLIRNNTQDNTPAVIHVEFVKGSELTIDILLKGGGSENMSAMRMLNPTATSQEIKNAVTEIVKRAHGKPCPPIILGIGIGGNFETAPLLAKKALTRPINDESVDETIKELEKEILESVNELGIGPMGYGGKTTCLAVKILTGPCHIASLPLAVNIQCHSARHLRVVL